MNDNYYYHHLIELGQWNSSIVFTIEVIEPRCINNSVFTEKALVDELINCFAVCSGLSLINRSNHPS
jgi:hypothetical protein